MIDQNETIVAQLEAWSQDLAERSERATAAVVVDISPPTPRRPHPAVLVGAGAFGVAVLALALALRGRDPVETVSPSAASDVSANSIAAPGTTTSQPDTTTSAVTGSTIMEPSQVAGQQQTSKPAGAVLADGSGSLTPTAIVEVRAELNTAKLTVVIAAAPTFDDNNPCSRWYEPVITESDESVSVNFVVYQPTVATGTCRAIAATRTVTVDLARPVGDRTVKVLGEPVGP
jgi:hypothetical protein